MNIDVINILNDAFNACNIVDNSHLFDDLAYKLDDILIYDIIKFIECISIYEGEERVLNFKNEYLKGKDIKNVEMTSTIKSISIPLFSLFDLKCKSNTTNTIEQLFYIIGKNYMFSKFDKKDFDVNAFKTYINEIEHYISSNNDKKVLKTGSKKEENISVKEKVKGNELKEENNSYDEKSLQELLDEFNSLIGLNNVKKEVKKRINQIRVDKRREQEGYKKSSMSLHLVFTGNPGTGKTTVARKLAAIYKKLGVLSRGQLVEVDRSKLVGGYVGSTAIKTQEVIDKAIGGILFIDEAYTLSYGKGDNDFGQEAIDTLLKAMEDKRDDFIVIVAGYTNEMNEFVNSNPGLQSRFNKYIDFDDYTANELYEIFKLTCKNDEKIIHEECDEYLKNHFEEMIRNKTSNFANGRTVRNYYEKVVEAMNERLVDHLDEISNEELQLIRLTDLYV